MTETLESAGKVVIVTGTGGPTGAAVARHLGARGHRVVAVCSSREAATGVHESIRDAGGVSFAFAADVEDRQADAELVAQTLATFGRIDALVHTRVGRDTGAPFAETDDEAWDRLLSVSLTGTYRLVQQVLPRFVAQGSGAVVVVASGGGAGFTHAVATGATRAFVEKLARENAGTGVRVNAISLGPLDTGAPAAPGLPAVGILDGAAADRPAVTLTEAAEAIEFLISDAAAAVSGTTLRVDRAARHP
ncbi:MAG: SDR family oxidoreductase [Microbacteriaceae bacterium]